MSNRKYLNLFFMNNVKYPKITYSYPITFTSTKFLYARGKIRGDQIFTGCLGIVLRIKTYAIY